jgi:hypothetical protein
MRSQARVRFLMVVCGVLLAGVVPSLAQGFGVKEFAAVNCKEAFPECASTGAPFYFPKEPTKTEAATEGFTQAGGRVPFGVTTFKVDTEGAPGHEYPAGTVAGGEIVDPTKLPVFIRTDVGPGLSTNPFAPERCSMKDFDHLEVAKGAFLEPECGEGSEIGINHVVVFVPEAVSKVAGGADVPLEGTVYNLDPGAGWASKFGVAVSLEPLGKPGVFVHTIINGNVEWGTEAKGTEKGDYHDYFEIEVSPELPLVSSRLSFYGNVGAEGKKGEGNFITNATNCTNEANLITRIAISDLGGETKTKSFKTPVGLTGCSGLEFDPTFALAQTTTQSDQPTELTAEAAEVHNPATTDVSQVKSATFTLPEGMTLNPSAAHGLEACTPAQAHQISGNVFTSAFGVACPIGSKIGTVSLDVPTLPDGSLTGSVYLGAPASGTITGPPYTMYVVAESPESEYKVSVRLVAEVVPNEATGQVTTYFKNAPEQPFSNLTFHFERGVLAPVANPLVCGTPQGSSTFEPTAAPELAAKTAAFGASVTGCASTIPFSLSQSSENETGNGGGHTSWTYGLTRPEGNQYLQTVKTTLPPGLVGNIPAVTLCGEPQAAQGTCTNASKIGTVSVAAGSGSSPYVFNGSVYMTGPYGGAPFGLSIVVPAVAGPFNLGNVVSRATINVNPSTAQVTSVATLPTIVKGIPVRLRSLTVTVNKQGFLDNPTNCSQWNVESELTSTEGKPQTGLKTPFQVANCGSLAFSPKFSAATSAKTSRANGASLTTTLTATAGQANIKSVKVQLPRQLPSRLSTLNKACTEAQFNANPLGCPAASKVGTATVITPTLGKPMTGPAIFVSHGGEAFPDLDLVVEGEGVRVILVGNTNIKNNITTTTFASTPDVPVTSVTVSLPAKSNSALAAYGDICRYPLTMPTTITGQNGKEVKSTTKIAVSGCGVKVIGHKVIGNTAYLTVKTFAAGRVSGTGNGVSRASRSFSGAQNAATLKVPLSSSGKARRKPLKVKIRVGFVPRKGAHSTTYVTVTYR